MGINVYKMLTVVVKRAGTLNDKFTVFKSFHMGFNPLQLVMKACNELT